MFITKRKLREIENRLSNLERKSVAESYEFGEVDLQKLVKKLPQYIKKAAGNIRR